MKRWGNVRSWEKGPADMVTEADFASQRVIREIITRAYPNHAFVGEEEESTPRTENFTPTKTASACYWVVDPLDGTTNFVHGLPIFSVSVAVVRAGEPVAGAIFNPVTKELFLAAAGEGASLNGARVRVSGARELSQSLVAASFGTTVDLDGPEVGSFLRLLPQARAIRRLGSSALNLAFVACGRLDAYWTMTAHPWDVAAGMLLVREAGGAIVSLGPETPSVWRPNFVTAASRELAEQIRSLGCHPSRAPSARRS